MVDTNSNYGVPWSEWPLPQVQPNPISRAAHGPTLLPTFLYKRAAFMDFYVGYSCFVLCRGWVTRKLFIPALPSIHEHWLCSCSHVPAPPTIGSLIKHISARSGRCHCQLGLTFGDFDGFCAIFTLQDHFQRFLGLFTLCTAIPAFLH